ncbi:hypothetical protein BGP_0474 [Beggiatoa sp. PS]|nr:hypothetical protein BGP_0474 [Beggiatoa sp. PS]
MANVTHPNQLKGPRSFFTDLDPRDPDYNKTEITRRLKLQLLTKEKLIIPASSLFHEIGYHLIVGNKKDEGLVDCLEKGIILPAIRNQFHSVENFFENKKEYSKQAKQFFTTHVSDYVSWDLKENSMWFKEKFYEGLQDTNSLLREKTSLSNEVVSECIYLLDKEIQKDSSDNFLRREHIEKVGKHYNQTIQDFFNSYANLVYRISGARVVNSEGHFPQSNLTRLGITGNEQDISDDSIFWDIYVEAVMSFLNSAVKLTTERLDNLTFSDILKIRQALFNITFSQTYDELISAAKQKISISDPDKLILKQQEIILSAQELREVFKEKIRFELETKNCEKRENSLWQVANVLALVSTPQIGMLVGCLNALKSLPEITVAFSKNFAETMDLRLKWMRNYINSKREWNTSQKQSLLDAYKELITYGLND